ncbi:MAG: HesB/IscA family protein [Planctomycetota bacterium]
MAITITDHAARKAKELLEREGKTFTNPGLRVKVVGGGCSGLSYQLAFDDGPKAGDEVFEHDGFRVFVDKKSLLYLNGSQLDYSEGLSGAGFRFSNPNVKGSCGCGESFHV